jgi:hypothetical protein
MNCEESMKISGKPTIAEAAEYFVNQNIGAFMITNGANELYAFSNGGLFEKTKLLARYLVVRAMKWSLWILTTS